MKRKCDQCGFIFENQALLEKHEEEEQKKILKSEEKKQ